ncbi:MAG: hypothetical protein ACJ8FT_04135 [Sphingomonas sp.]
MRRLFAFSLALLAAACATRPQAPPSQAPAPQLQSKLQGSLLGLGPQDLVGRFGRPALQIREGTSVKLQFRGSQCVLDAYLYPAQNGALRVTHVDTRSPSGLDISQAGCISALESPS